MPTCPSCKAPDLTALKKGGWLCPDCEQRFTDLAPETASDAAASHALDLAGLPFPVAYPMAWARNPALAPRDRLGNAIFAAYQAMRLTGLLLLADYLACETTSRDLAAPIRGLRMPHWGEWSLLGEQLAKFWRGGFHEKPTRSSHFPALVDGWLEVNRANAPKRGDDPWKSLLDGLPGSSGKARSANDAIQKLRNDRAHRMATITVDQGEDERLLGWILPVVEHSIGRLFPAGSLMLVRCVETAPEGLRILRLHGSHTDLRFDLESLSTEWATAFEATGVAALVGDAAVPVYPLFVPGDEAPDACRVGSGGLVEPVSLIDGVKEKRLVLLGVHSHGESERHVAPLLEALARKQVDPGQDRAGTTRWTLAGWSRATAREALNSLRGRKYFPECYVERRRVDDVLSSCLERPGQALLVLGEAGAGKSSLLARLADRLSAEETEDEEGPESARWGKKGKKDKGDEFERYLAAKGGGDVVLFLSGTLGAFAGDAHKDGAALLCDAVLQRAGVRAGAFNDLAAFASRLAETANDDTLADRRVWLLLDALNEAARFTDLLTALDAFLPALEKHPWLRVVVSLRSGAYHALARRKLTGGDHGDGVLSNERCLHAFHDERSGKELPYLDLRPFDEADEGRQAYALRQSALPDRASARPYSGLDPALRRLLLSPLHLHVFHETFRGERNVPTAMDEGTLLDAYLECLCTGLPAMRETLREIGRLMVERRSPLLPLDVADAWLSQWRAAQPYESAARVAKLDPIEELVAASVLMRPSEEGIGVDRRLVGFQFGHQTLCERVLVRERLRQIAPRTLPTGEELLAWARHAAGPEVGEHGDDFAEAVGAVEVLAVRLAEAGEGDVLSLLLDLDDEPVRTRILGAAIRALGPAWGTSATGGSKPAGVIRALVDRALAERRLEKHFAASVSPAWQSLKTTGFSRAAEALARGHLRVLRRLSAEEPHNVDLYEELSNLLLNLGDLAENAGRSDEARTFFNESLSVTEAGGRSGEALTFFEQILAAIRRAVGLDRRHTYVDMERGRAVALNKLGCLALAGGRFGEARAFLEKSRDSIAESLALLRRVAALNPDRADILPSLSARIFLMERDLAAALGCLGDIACAVGRSDEASTFFTESLTVMRRLAAAEPDRVNLQRDLSVFLRKLGGLAKAAGRSDEARTFFEEALTLMRSAVAVEPYRADLQRDLSVSLGHLGHLALDAGRSDEARTFLEEARALIRNLVTAEPHRADLQLDLVAALGSLGDLARAADRVDETRTFFEESLAVMRRLVAVEHNRLDLQHNLSLCLTKLGKVVGRSEEARTLFEESLAIARRLVAAEPDRVDQQLPLWFSLNHLGNLAREGDRSDEARTFFDESLVIARRLVAAEPHRADLCLGLGISYWDQLSLATPEQEVHYLRLVLETLRPLREVGYENAQLEQLWTMAEMAIAKRHS